MTSREAIFARCGRALGSAVFAVAALAAGPSAAQLDGDDPFAELGAPADEAENALPESTPGVTVTLRAIDKLRGDVETIEAEVGGSVTLWRLQVYVRACFRRPEERAPESSVFLQILDTKHVRPIGALASQAFPVSPLVTAISRSAEPDYEDPVVFSGWMFASSPALSAMDHPRYDVWVLSCNIS